MSIDTRILEPGTLEAPRGKIRPLLLPPGDLFASRAGRLRSLSNGHPLQDYLAFLAILADIQQDAFNQFPALSLPDAYEQSLSRSYGRPLFHARFLRRDPAWREGLQVILQEMQEAALPSVAHEAIVDLMQESEARLEHTADSILAGDLAGVAPRELPLVSAALQVYWARLASSMQEDAFDRWEQGGSCPVCASAPVAGIVYGCGEEQGLRYLSCSLCASQWHKVRLTCSSCAATGGLDYFALEGSTGAVKAESCEECKTYLKLLYLEKDPQMDATADDLATLNLDVLMQREGKVRRGPNLFFHPGRTQ